MRGVVDEYGSVPRDPLPICIASIGRTGDRRFWRNIDARLS